MRFQHGLSSNDITKLGLSLKMFKHSIPLFGVVVTNSLFSNSYFQCSGGRAYTESLAAFNKTGQLK